METVHAVKYSQQGSRKMSMKPIDYETAAILFFLLQIPAQCEYFTEIDFEVATIILTEL